MEITQEWLAIGFLFTLIAGVLAGGGIGFFVATLRNAKQNITLMTVFENNYATLSDERKRQLETLERATQLIGDSIPIKLFGDGFREVSSLLQEISDDIPLRKKQPTLSGEDSPLPTSTDGNLARNG